jgi:tRNA(adenine34) deaminase
MMQPDDGFFMKQALLQARRAFEEDEVPVGAVIVQDGKIIARGYNQVEKLRDCTAHAEIISLTSAFSLIGGKYLPDATIYITVEPCLMCAGALYWSKIGRIVYGADDIKNGYRRIADANSPFHPKTVLVKGFIHPLQPDLGSLFFDEICIFATWSS